MWNTKYPPQNDQYLRGASVLRIQLNWISAKKKKKRRGKKEKNRETKSSSAHWPTFLMSTSYWSHRWVEQDSLAPSRCWGGGCDWSVAVGVSAFRTELSAAARAGEGTVASVRKPPRSFPEEYSGPSPGSRDALHVHQHADPPGVYPAPASDSLRGGALESDVQGDLLIWQSDAAHVTYQWRWRVKVMHWPVILCMRGRQQTGCERSIVLMLVLLSFFLFLSFFLSWCPKLKTHVAQSSACACSLCCLHDSSSIIPQPQR